MQIVTLIQVTTKLLVQYITNFDYGYDYLANPWHPNRCLPLTTYDPARIQKHTRCQNSSIILWGDSRIRILFGGLVGKMYSEEDVVFE